MSNMGYKELKLELKRRYKWYHHLYDTVFYWFIGLHHPKKVLNAIYDHKDVRDVYGTLLSDDVEPARELIKDFQEYVECEVGDSIEVIVLK